MGLASSVMEMRVIEIFIGLVSIGLGYRLFCELPLDRSYGSRSRFVTNLAAGSLLALFGMASLVSAAGAGHSRVAHSTARHATRSSKLPRQRLNPGDRTV